MSCTALRRLIRRHCQQAVVLAMLPLAILNGLPFAQGCICADGHYEPVCHANDCRTGKSDCGCPCCAKRSCCSAHSCCEGSRGGHSVPTKTPPGQTFGNSCCTPLVHQGLPTVIAAPHFTPGEDIAIYNVAPVEPPYLLSVEMMHSGHRIEMDTGPHDDLVVTLQRFII